MRRVSSSGCALLAWTLVTPGAAAAPVAASASSSSASQPTDQAANKTRPIRVAIPNMVSSNSDSELAKTLTQVLTIEVNKVRGIEAIGMADIEALLNHEQQKALLGCEDASCIAEIGGALGVDALLSSSIGRVGDTIVLSIRLNDTHTARQIGSAYETVAGKPDELIKVVQRKVPEVMRSAQPAWAIAEVATQEPPPDKKGLHVRVGSEEKSAPFHLVWPAVGVAGVGLVALAAAAGLGIASVAVYSEANSSSSKIDGTSYLPIGTQVDVVNASYLGYAGIGALAVGVTAVGAGVIWQLLAGGGSEEEQL